MFCSKCGNIIFYDSKFCSKCGMPVSNNIKKKRNSVLIGVIITGTLLVTALVIVLFVFKVFNKNDKSKFSEIKKGQVITFGKYEQDNDISTGKEAIEWIVLYVDEENDEALLMSKYALDGKPYVNSYDYDLSFYKAGRFTPWEECDLRTWLNNDFYENAFTDDEKDYIKITKLDNSYDLEEERIDGGFTKDKIFILSCDDIINPDFGFSPDVSDYDINRRCVPTKFAIANSVYQYDNADNNGYTEDGKGCCPWML